MLPLFRWQVGFVLLLLLLELSCRKRQHAAAPITPAPAASVRPSPVPAAQPKLPAAPEALPAPPPLPAAAAPAQTSPFQVNLPPQNMPPPPRKASRSASAPTPVPARASQPASSDPPQLVDIVTPDQQRQLNSAIDQSLSRAEASLANVAKRELSSEQKSLLEQIRSMIRQAQDSRRSDLPGAKSLAERAEVLATDLVESFH